MSEVYICSQSSIPHSFTLCLCVLISPLSHLSGRCWLIAFNKAAKWARGVKTIFSWLCSDQNRYFKPNHDAILTLTKWLLCLGINTALAQKRNRKSNPILMFPFCTETYLAHNYSGDCADHMSFFVKHFGAKTCLRLKCLHTQDKLGFLLGWWVKHKLFQTH